MFRDFIQITFWCYFFSCCRIEAKEYAQREAATLKTIKHDGIIQLVDAFEIKDAYFIVTDLAEGGDLATLIQNKKQVSSQP